MKAQDSADATSAAERPHLVETEQQEVTAAAAEPSFEPWPAELDPHEPDVWRAIE